MNCMGSVWKSVLAGTVNTREYYQVDMTQTTPNSYTINTKYCSAEVCSTATSVLDTPASGVFTTTLKTAEWFPTLNGYQILQSASPHPKSLSGVFNLKEAASSWVLEFKGSDVMKLKLRFYKINA